FAVIVLFILFQPEIRKFLEQLGRSNYTYRRLMTFFAPAGSADDLPPISQYLSIYLEGIDVLKKSKTGALIVFERRTALGDIAQTGTVIKAAPSINLMGNIFFNKAPLHDGAMIVRDGIVYAAGCILPLTHDHKHVDDHLGTRHRAAIGMSEVSDAVVVVVSEETGSVSVALNGEITRDYTKESLEKELYRLLIDEESRSSGKGVLTNKAKIFMRKFGSGAEENQEGEKG
ncbi:MAG: diadenylate cyclase, partial [Clostridia bacterium]|nr:diadenylate cyclase [Clostridia bacterium]